MEKVWYQDHFPVGMTLSGETLKDLASQELFDASITTINDEMVQPEDIDFSTIDDKEVWVIALNTNSGTIQFIQIFTADRVVIETTTKPEVKTPPPYDFANAL